MESKKIEIETIAGDFIVDMGENKLIWKVNPDIEVFLSEAAFDGKNYRFILDRYVPYLEVDSLENIMVSIPQLVDIDRDEFIRQYNLQGQDLEGKNDQEAKMLQPALAARLAGTEVVIDIAGDLYEIDYCSDNLVALRNQQAPTIMLDHICKGFDHSSKTFMLNADTREVTKILSDKNIIVQIPPLYSLDPVGFAETYGRFFSTMVQKSGPLKNHHIAATMKLVSTEQKINQRPVRKRGLGH